MVKVLVTSDKWVSRRTLKGALCKAASPELIDYCLKHIAGRVVGDGIKVRARCNPNSNAVEYRYIFFYTNFKNSIKNPEVLSLFAY